MTQLDPAEFRRVLGHLPTGVTIITAVGARGPIGMAANSVVSVSLDPPLVLFCPARTSETWPELRATGRFCINVMGADHEEVCRQFSRRGEDRFRGVGWREHPGGPALDEAVACLSCDLYGEHDAGDHTIVVAKVTRLETAPELVAPLVFFRGEYGTFARTM